MPRHTWKRNRSMAGLSLISYILLEKIYPLLNFWRSNPPCRFTCQTLASLLADHQPPLQHLYNHNVPLHKLQMLYVCYIDLSEAGMAKIRPWVEFVAGTALVTHCPAFHSCKPYIKLVKMNSISFELSTSS